MNKELIKPTEIVIKDKKKVIKGQVVRAAIVARSKVMDVLTEDHERYYFIYYKNSLIYGEKLDQVEEGTFIDKAFQEGIIIQAPHPLLTALIPSLNVSIPNKNKLFSQLENHFSPQERTVIATTLDSFYTKEQLMASIDQIYFHFRRAGSFLKSFQVIQLLFDFSPTNSVKDRLGSLEYTSYHHLYQSTSLSSLYKKDPLFVELHCFRNRSNPEKRLFLADILSKEDRLLELLLWLENLESPQEATAIQKYTEIALRLISMEDWIQILSEVNINPFQALPETKAVVKKMIQDGEFEKVALSLFKFIDELPSSYNPILEVIWNNSDHHFVLSHFENFIQILQHLPHDEKQTHYEEKIGELAVGLLKEHELPAVYKKLSPIQTLHPSEVIRKIDEMVKIVEDPDQMMELGNYFAEFKQFDKAIDCFFWEMEMQPQNPDPVRKISKMYQHKGMLAEASMYQKIYNQLKTNQETG